MMSARAATPAGGLVFPTSRPDPGLLSIYMFIKDFVRTSGANAVAIDNKIEQAMDLVKSHLMYAVREEVEVLKEKISELMERIGQLEAENATLRAGASPETLAQLPPGSQSQTSNNP